MTERITFFRSSLTAAERDCPGVTRIYWDLRRLHPRKHWGLLIAEARMHWRKAQGVTYVA